MTVGTALPATPLAHALGFQPLPGGFFAALAAMILGYLLLIEVGKRIFYRSARAGATVRVDRPHRHLRRRVAQFGTAGPAHPARAAR